MRHRLSLFADVAGVDEAKEEVGEIVDFLRATRTASAVGGRIPKGVGWSALPGTGKTLLARSIAGEAKVPFLFASGSDFVEMYAWRRGGTSPEAASRCAASQGSASCSSTNSTPWAQPGRQLAQSRGARADTQSVARRNGWFRAQSRHRFAGRHQPARHSRSRHSSAPAASIDR